MRRVQPIGAYARDPAPPPRRTLERVLQLLENGTGDSGAGRGAVLPVPAKRSLEGPASAPTCTRFYNVLWGKASTKKHKTYSGDGRLESCAGSWRLTSDTGAPLGTARASVEHLTPGLQLRIGNKEVEIVEECFVADKMELSKPSNPSTGQQPVAPAAYKRPKICNQFVRGAHHTKPLVFPRPASEHQWCHNARKQTVRDVTLDSILSRSLRPHQKDGVVFLYECVMGFRNPNYFGVILADEMGLGKTLQSIALIWTLLKQGPYGTVVCKKILIITPSSLCANWKKEFTMWLGSERIQTYVVDKSHKVSAFSQHPLVPVMIISYELFVRSFDSIQTFNFDLIVCDEGHRLKNSSVKASQLLCKLGCKRRLLLTGTPVQNDLEEYFSVINVVNPGILGTYTDFRRNYEEPIVAAQEPNCEESAKLLAEEKSAELNSLISKFILRRTADIMENYLPSKEDLILCCSLSKTQKTLYQSVTEEWFNTETKNPLAVIAILRKICNHPFLLGKQKDYVCSELTQSSGKLTVIDSFLKQIVINKNENIVLVSYSTRFLDLLQLLCQMRQLHYLRLDGSTPVSQRKAIVDSFNQHVANIFLLSARAGGTGLNLTGASRLILTDGDWNPSNDLQALARIWRDGQKCGVKIYRLICTGTIEEKIFQRQLSKLSLSDSVDDPEKVKTVPKFSKEELKDLFTPNFSTDSITHDVLKCTCLDEQILWEDNECENEPHIGVNELKDWKHFKGPFHPGLLQDIGLQDDQTIVTFVFQKITNHSSGAG